MKELYDAWVSFNDSAMSLGRSVSNPFEVMSLTSIILVKGDMKGSHRVLNKRFYNPAAMILRSGTTMQGLIEDWRGTREIETFCQGWTDLISDIRSGAVEVHPYTRQESNLSEIEKIIANLKDANEALRRIVSIRTGEVLDFYQLGQMIKLLGTLQEAYSRLDILFEDSLPTKLGVARHTRQGLIANQDQNFKLSEWARSGKYGSVRMSPGADPRSIYPPGLDDRTMNNEIGEALHSEVPEMVFRLGIERWRGIVGYMFSDSYDKWKEWVSGVRAGSVEVEEVTRDNIDDIELQLDMVNEARKKICC